MNCAAAHADVSSAAHAAHVKFDDLEPAAVMPTTCSSTSKPQNHLNISLQLQNTNMSRSTTDNRAYNTNAASQQHKRDVITAVGKDNLDFQLEEYISDFEA
jgi:hypothetical protein